jgi:F420-non-reducing hydrogenase iron-sulfur subunit
MNIDKEFEPRIAAFFCTWCSYGAADLAGVNRMEYPAVFRVIRVPCTGRISPSLILHAFRQGADGVWISGCHPGDCHYLSGNLHARRRFQLFKNLMEFTGVDPDRLHFSWISSAEAEKFQSRAREISRAVAALGPSSSLVKTLGGEAAS